VDEDPVFTPEEEEFARSGVFVEATCWILVSKKLSFSA
jgi:hypothetical protein